MQIVKPGAGFSAAFIVQAGKQITLSATGLAGDDYVAVEIVTLSRAPEFNGNACCAATSADIRVLSFTPLMCNPSSPVVMTAATPYVVLEGPQLVTLRAAVYADPGAEVTVELLETDSTGVLNPCQCVDATWKQTGEVRCVGANVESEEESNCGTKRWTVTGATVWTDTGEIRCVGNNREKEQVNTCGTARWVADGTVTWTFNGQTKCENHLVYNQEANDCGTTRWTATTQDCGYCPSMRLSCTGQGGFGFHVLDPKDPLATVEMAPCPDCLTQDSIWIYPSAGPGHTIKVTKCDGTLIGYAANQSDCAEDCGCD